MAVGKYILGARWDWSEKRPIINCARIIADLWAVGCILAEMDRNEHLFTKKKHKGLGKEMLRRFGTRQAAAVVEMWDLKRKYKWFRKAKEQVEHEGTVAAEPGVSCRVVHMTSIDSASKSHLCSETCSAFDFRSSSSDWSTCSHFWTVCCS